MMREPEIIVCDQTIREGMQYRGMVFTAAERLKILHFQEMLGVDVSQAAYPSAHETEQEILKHLVQHARQQAYRIRIAGLGRALIPDVDLQTVAGSREVQMHAVMTDRPSAAFDLNSFLASLESVIHHVRGGNSDVKITVSILDIGKTDPDMIAACVRFLSRKLEVDGITLPDTSGCLAPNLLYKRIQDTAAITADSPTHIGVHCHNDMGMASANTVLGAVAGAAVIEVSALGIGERNGIGDLFLVGKALTDQGYRLNLDTGNLELFQDYYRYVDALVTAKTGTGILGYNTPFFGESMRTHVAGTHGANQYGLSQGNCWFLNVLCGKHLVKQFLEAHEIPYLATSLPEIVDTVKSQSASLGRCLSPSEVATIAGLLR